MSVAKKREEAIVVAWKSSRVEAREAGGSLSRERLQNEQNVSLAQAEQGRTGDASKDGVVWGWIASGRAGIDQTTGGGYWNKIGWAFGGGCCSG